MALRFDWREEYWKLFAAFGALWGNRETLQNQLDRLVPYAGRLERKNARLESDNERLLTDNNRLRNDNLRLRGKVDLAEENIENDIAGRLETELARVQAA